MKIQIRRNVFETNSSSVHSMTMCSDDEYKKWENGELLFHRWYDELVDANDSKAKEAREKSGQAEFSEKVEMQVLASYADDEGKLLLDKIEENIKNNITPQPTIDKSEEGKLTITSADGKYTYVVEGEKVIATVPCGYADGIPRGLSNKGYVLIHGVKAPIVGRVCMDQFMVDVTDICEV